MGKRAVIGAATGLAILAGQPALSQDWEFQITPYAWLLGMDGDIGSFGLPAASADLSFGDIWDNLDYAFFALGAARKDDFAIFFDGSISQLSYDRDVGGAQVDSVELISKTSNMMVSIGGTLSKSPTHRLEAYGGARAWWLSNEFKVNTTAPGTLSEDSDANWVDPVVGLIGTYQLNERFTLFGTAEIGGFGVGSDSSWSVFAGTTYNLNDRINLALGWRTMSVDYSNDEVIFDVTQSGPVIGATFRF